MPNNIQISKLKYIFKERSEKVSDKQFTPLSVTRDGVKFQIKDIAMSDNHENRKKVNINDIAINSRSARKGSSGHSKYEGSVSTVNNVIFSDKLLPEFTHYLLKTNYFMEEYYRIGKGIHDDLWGTKFEQMGEILLPVPSKTEQLDIVNKINKQIPNIKEKIETKKKFIDLIKEKRRSTIHETVTKGINEKNNFKKSNIFWVEEIPKSWNINKLKYVADLIVEKEETKIDDTKISPEYVQSETGKVLNYNSEHGLIGSKFKKNDILFNKLRVYLNKVFISDRDGYSMGEMIVIRAKSIETKYLYYVLTSNQFIDYCNSFSNGVKVPRPPVDSIFNIKIPLPSKEEQIKISNFLDKELNYLDNLIIKDKRVIDLLEEKKISIISEIVFKNYKKIINELH